MEIEAPIFFVGVGRSGSTVFARQFTAHPRLAYPTRLCNRFPDRPRLQRAGLRAIDLPLLGTPLRSRLDFSEAYDFWDYHAPGFSQPVRDLRANDVTAAVRSSLRRAVGQMLTARRHRFYAKITGWARIGYLRNVFPDARFVHVVRDGRDVANSLLHVRFWRGWRGPSSWRIGPLPPELGELWERHDRSFAALAGIAWILLTRSVEEGRALLPDDAFLQIRYEDFVAEPVQRTREVLDFAGLHRDPSLEREVAETEIYDSSGKYRRQLTMRQQKILEDVLEGQLSRYGY